ncbi:hypothetical protein RJ640_009940 [Escallonia rubra]|uniref:Uncharacterized protein n=1 Tax=Escallonia rubra TaxID=112253 RepID=A0AA88SBL0_9ASTE|nr:hypothetical protein RJ640_009940 [Escallonia rubra]
MDLESNEFVTIVIATRRRRHRHSPSPVAPFVVAAVSVPVNFPGSTFSNGIKAAFYAVFLAQLSDTVLGALLASHETEAIALSFVLYYLADHPDVYAKVLKANIKVQDDSTEAFGKTLKLEYFAAELDPCLISLDRYMLSFIFCGRA